MRNLFKIREENLYHYVRIVPGADTDISVSLITKFMEHLYGYRRPLSDEIKKGKVWFRYLIHRMNSGELIFYFGFPEDRTTGVIRMLKMLFPTVEIVDTTHSDLPFSLDDSLGDDLVGASFRAYDDMRSGYAFKNYDASNEFEDILFSMGDESDSEVWLDIQLAPDHPKTLISNIKKSISSMQKSSSSNSFLSDVGLSQADFAAAFNGKQRNVKSPKSNSVKDLSQDKKEKLKSLSQRYTGREPVFSVAIKILVHGKHPDSQLQTIAATLKRSVQLDNMVYVVKQKKIERSIFNSKLISAASDRIIMTGPELGNIVRLPASDHRIYERIPHVDRGQILLRKDELSKGIHIGNLDHPAEKKERSVRIPVKEMLKHFFLSGQTGSGKSSMLMEIMDGLIQDFIDNPGNGVGFTLFDPAQETAASVLNRLNHYEKMGRSVDWSKVHYFNFNQDEYVLPMNLLHTKVGENIYNVSNDVIELITSAFDPAPQMERILRNSLVTLLSDSKVPHSILGLIPLLLEEKFRNKIVPSCITGDYSLTQFWNKEFPDLAKNTKSLIGPLLNRLSPIQTNADMRRMFGHHEMRLQIKKWMDEGHIVLFDIKGLSTQGIKLAGGFVASQYHKEAQTRPTGSKAHLLIIDEAHEVQYPVLSTIMAKDRKHGLSLGLSTQYLDQMDKYLLDSVSENVGNIFSARQGPKSAKMINKMTNGSLDEGTLQGLNDNRIAIYTWSLVKGEKRRATATVRCAPPYIFIPDGSGRHADHENDVQMAQAFKWGLYRGFELLKRDGVSARGVDKSILNYMKKGSPLETSVSNAENEIKLTKKWE